MYPQARAVPDTTFVIVVRSPTANSARKRRVHLTFDALDVDTSQRPRQLVSSPWLGAAGAELTGSLAGPNTAQIVCNNCRMLLSYPRGAPSVQCALCQHITQVCP
jgi:LSD1 subclass zinc finger protein